ncbi:MAG: polyhydroxyalkanoate synthesis repressor PhaR, partial [Rhodanobacter sp.]
IKKYANRRLYNTATSSYVTLDHLCQMVKEGLDFVVYDAKTGDDITRSVLTQIIVEEEAKGQNLLPINFLRQLISFYGDNLQFLLPGYLDQSMESFARNQEQMRRYMQDSFGGMFPFGRFEEMSKQNLAFFEKAMKMFVPFKGEGPVEAGEAKAGEGGKTGGGATPSQERGGDAALASLKDQVDALQKQLEALSREKPDRGE